MRLYNQLNTMFTGIITHLATVKSLTSLSNQDLLITLELLNQNADRNFDIGCSISCNGVCLTLTEKKTELLSFQASPETLQKTNIKNWKINDKINLEFALRMGDELGGHLVAGHIDNVAMVKEIKAINQDSWQFLIALPQDLKKFVAPKGSVVLNGVSLTVNEVFDDSFGVNIIKHTFDHTNFSHLKIGDLLNLEVDLIARYLANLVK